MRLKIKNLNKAIENLTGAELSLYTYIVQRTDINGLLQDLSMKQTILKIGISKQHFYNCLYSLEEKGFLYVSQTKAIGYDILLIDNKFSSEKDSTEPYLNLHYKILNTVSFHRLPVAIKKFLLRALSFAGKNKWSVSEDTLKSYKLTIDDILQFFKIKDLGLNKQKDRHFNLQLFSQFTKIDRNIFYLHYHHRLLKFLSKNKISYTQDTLNTSIQVLSNFRSYPGLAGQSLAQMKNKFLLQPKLITYIINFYKIKIENKKLENLLLV
jgi:hypothetical protein